MGIVIAAIITALVALVVYGGALWRVAPRAERPLLALLLGLQLPVSVATFYLVRRPLDGVLAGAIGDSGIYRPLTLLYAPLTEEPAKLWPLLVPALARRVTREGAVRAAVALGLGFGLGEIALVARLVLADARYAGLPAYAFGGFINERFMVCLVHGGFTALALCGWRGWRGGLPGGLLLAMAAHFVGNVAIPLVQSSPFGRNAALAATALSLWVTLLWVACLVGLPALHSRLAGPAAPGTRPALFGESVCPECGRVYPRSLLALNLGPQRYERCPHCRKWHFVSLLGPRKRKDNR